MTNIRTTFVLFILIGFLTSLEAQYIRYGNKYVTESKKRCRYDGDIEDQFYYRDVIYVFTISTIYNSYASVSTLDSVKVVGSVERGKENGLFSLYLMDGSMIATAEMKAGKINGKVTFFFNDQETELYLKNRRIINPLRNRRNCANRNGHT